MAKVKAPLFSLSASGQIAKTLVFFPWKGLNAVRSYVIPANPKTEAQDEQRDYLTDAVAAIHSAMVTPDTPLWGADKSAYALWGTLFKGPRTWFNQAVKHWLDQARKELATAIFRHGEATDAVPDINISLWAAAVFDKTITDGVVRYGRTKAALLQEASASFPKVGEQPTGEIIATLINLISGKLYYWQFQGKTTDNDFPTKSGLYTAYAP